MNNGVSCLCLTYGRPHLLEEAIESFLRQTWEGDKELIVVNDHPDQTLVFDHPHVIVINIPRRLRTLGEKRNLSVSLAKYNNLLIWDDDDIYLPWRIEETMKKLPQDNFYKCPNAWLMNDGRIEPTPSYNLFHGGTAYTRWLWEQVGGYKSMNGGEDAEIEGKFQKVGTNSQYWPHTQLTDDRLYYIYRWNHGSYHTTGHASLDGINPPVDKGVIKLNPKWHLPYQEMAHRASNVPAKVEPKASKSPINFIAFSKNRPLQLDGYIRSLKESLAREIDLSVIYTCDTDYQNAYDELISAHPWVTFRRETNFHQDLIASLNDAEFTCFGCDDVVFTKEVDFDKIVEVMRRQNQFAFSLRLGKNITRSMFSGQVSHPEYAEHDGVLTWDLHRSHAHGDFGYSWELDGTVYHTDIVKKVINDVQPSSPNILEANGGGRWSRMTQKRYMSCFPASCMTVPSVNVVQTNFANSTVGKPVSVKFLLDAWHWNMRLDIGRYRECQNDCIHIGELYLTNR